MATVNAQSVEDFADRIVYRYEPGIYLQAAAAITSVTSPGLKTLVNSDTSRSYIVPASGLPARFYKIEWAINLSMVLAPVIGGTASIAANFVRLEIPSLNYDGKGLQTKFNVPMFETYYASAQLRSVNIGNISIEPKVNADVYSPRNTGGDIAFDSVNAVSYLSATLAPTITFYKK